jgi:hypothetical protein
MSKEKRVEEKEQETKKKTNFIKGSVNYRLMIMMMNSNIQNIRTIDTNSKS